MSRRGRSSDAGSLELLLDTMCNAFGGVMFIAILLVILSQFIDEREVVDTEEKTLEERRRRVELAAEAQRLEARLRLARADLDAAFRLHANRPLLDRLEELRKENASLKESRDAAREQVKKTSAQLTELDREKERRRTERTQLDEALRRLLEKLRERDKQDVRKLRMPRIRTVRKTPYWMIVKGNRLYVLHWPTRLSNIGPLNKGAVRRVEHKGYVDYEPVAGGGVDLKGKWRDSREVKAILADLPSRSHILYFAVFPDSYASFRKARDFFVEKGYKDYYWLIMAPSDLKLRLQYVQKNAFNAL